MGRNHYSLQFKQQAIAMTRLPGNSVGSVAKSLGIAAQVLDYWVKHPPKENQRRDHEPQTDDPVALKLLLKEANQRIARLEMEREILKKATAFFASQNP
jgi:transposase